MRKFYFAASILLFSASALAQSEHEVGSLTIQPKAGLNVATFVGSADKTEPRLGLAVGAEFEYQFTERFSLSAGALYSMQGDTEKTTEQGIQATAVVKTDYINIPVMANVYVAKGLALKFGLQPSFSASATYKMTVQGMSISGNLSDIGLDIHPFDFSVPVGISYEVNRFVVEGRYNMGITKISDVDASKNSVFQFTLGYTFSL